MGTKAKAEDGKGGLAYSRLALTNDVIWTEVAGVPVDGTSGTGAGLAGKGSLCSDRTNGKLYINGGTKASPVWKLVTSAA